MNHNLRKTTAKISAIVVIALLLYSYATHRSRQLEAREQAREQLQAKITNLIVQYKNGETQTIDLSKITSISWDRFYVFGPYIERADIEKVLGAPFRPDRGMPWPRSFNLLVFTLEGEVVQYVEWDAEFATFASLVADRPDGLSPDEARFVMSEIGIVLWIYDSRLQTK